MKIRGMFISVILVLASPVANADSWFKGPVNSVVKGAHAAYIAGDFAKVSQLIKHGLEDESLPAADRNNLLDLMTASYKVHKGPMPTDWRLPAEISKMNVEVTRQDHKGKVRYYLLLKGYGVRQGLVEQLQVVKFPDIVVIDKSQGVGEWEEEVWDGQPEFSAKTFKFPEMVPDGLYYLNVTLDNGQTTRGWFVLNGHNSSASPQVHTPRDGAVLKTSNPITQFENFTSPQYKEGERRALSVHMTRLYPEEDRWQYLWGFYESDPHLNEVTLGAANGDQSGVHFEDGLYYMSLKYRESVKFGDLRIRRTSKVNRTFRIGAD